MFFIFSKNENRIYLELIQYQIGNNSFLVCQKVDIIVLFILLYRERNQNLFVIDTFYYTENENRIYYELIQSESRYNCFMFFFYYIENENRIYLELIQYRFNR